MHAVVLLKFLLHHLHHGVLHALLGVGRGACWLRPLALQIGQSTAFVQRPYQVDRLPGGGA